MSLPKNPFKLQREFCDAMGGWDFDSIRFDTIFGHLLCGKWIENAALKANWCLRWAKCFAVCHIIERSTKWGN